MQINSHILKLTGKCELPKELAIGHNYEIALKGSVIAYSESDNDDGTVNRTYTFKPVTGEINTELGETIKAKDNRSNSQLIRSLLYKKWVNAASSESFEDFYDRVCRGIMRDVDELIDRYEVK